MFIRHRSELFRHGVSRKAIPHFMNALKQAQEIDMPRLIGSSLYNLGLCSFTTGHMEKALEYFKEGVSIYQSNSLHNSSRLLDILLMLAKTHFKLFNTVDGKQVCEQGLMLSKELNDDVLGKMFDFLMGLFVENDKERLLKS